MTKIKDPNRILANRCPHLVEEWHPTKNGELTPYNLTFGSNKKAWWICSQCTYEWKVAINHRSNGSGCPACAGKVATSWNSFKATNSHLIKEWYPTKNEILPEEVTNGSNKKVWWLCSKCNYEWETRICSRSNGSRCPACVGTVATPDNNLTTTHPHLAKEWHTDKNKMKPTEVTFGSNRKSWWKCLEC